MELVLKEKAKHALQDLDLASNEGIRLEARFVGSCSIYVDHYLWIDSKTEADDLYMVDSIPFLVSSESKQHLPEKLILNYNQSLGYKLSSPEETFTYNLSIKRRG
ncbi:iron-sulfur cluster biosynthesis family protein [Radiobacillus deserti]|uniref:Iron-sulfur cluster biosynthesis family protein n=1 Tax=Radiobacillus deserti TaxID=2594883 RepID=A0A516KCW2_9BACI|nr:iron-sulfur cluster biosynthesis family protein [Radiobacillus deserti]QDP39210.1 iron-sulfur cluster biosynthesis family protein [Radiobacillus deserti]